MNITGKDANKSGVSFNAFYQCFIDLKIGRDIVSDISIDPSFLNKSLHKKVTLNGSLNENNIKAITDIVVNHLKENPSECKPTERFENITDNNYFYIIIFAVILLIAFLNRQRLMKMING